MSSSSTCPTDQLLHELAAGLSSASAAERLRRHVAECAACRARLERAPAAPSPDPDGSRLTVSGDPDDEQSEPARDELYFLKPSDAPNSRGRLGEYEVQGVLGRGAMGIVLRAYDPTLCRAVAIKVLAPQLAANPKALRRFKREAQAAAAVNHPNVITIHAVSEQEGMPYLVMELVAGVNLGQRIRSGRPFDLASLLRISAQVAAGLAAAHEHGIVHRDIKPTNVMLEDGIERVKITDFGLARATEDLSRLTSFGMVVGTPAYLSPEQVRGEEATFRSDLFSLGCVLYAMAAGHSPFQAVHPIETARRIAELDPRPLHESSDAVPRFYSDLVARLLAKEADRRPASAAEVRDLLVGYLAQTNQDPYGLLEGARTPPPAPARRPRRRRLVAGVGLLALLVAGAAGAWLAGVPIPWLTRPAAANVIPVATEAGQGDYDDLAAALDHATPGTTLRLLGPGPFRGPLLIADPVRLAGLTVEAPDGAVLEDPRPMSDTVVMVRGTPDVTFRGLEIRTGPKQHAVSVWRTCPGLTLDRLRLRQPPAAPVGAVVFWNGACGTDDRPAVLRGLDVAAGAIGVVLLGKPEQPTTAVRVEDCRFTGPGVHVTVEAAAGDLRVAGNVFDGGKCGVSIALGDGDHGPVRVSNNTFFDQPNWLAVKTARPGQKVTITRNLIVQCADVQEDKTGLGDVAGDWFRDNMWETEPTPRVAAFAEARAAVPLVAREHARPGFLRPAPGAPRPGADNDLLLRPYYGALDPATPAPPP
jgi:hypothetical protein